MISRRDKLLKYPWEQQRYEQHRRKIQSAKPAIDVRTPHIYTHVITKAKKVQSEKERLQQIEKENVRLLQKLGDIMRTRRLDNVWLEPRPNFLNRQKLFEVPTESSLPRLISIYAPSYEDFQLKAPDAKMAKRCPTCRKCPEITEVFIPELRIPWQMNKKCISKRSMAYNKLQPKYCMHCGHLKMNNNNPQQK